MFYINQTCGKQVKNIGAELSISVEHIMAFVERKVISWMNGVVKNHGVECPLKTVEQ